VTLEEETHADVGSDPCAADRFALADRAGVWLEVKLAGLMLAVLTGAGSVMVLAARWMGVAFHAWVDWALIVGPVSSGVLAVLVGLWRSGKPMEEHPAGWCDDAVPTCTSTRPGTGTGRAAPITYARRSFGLRDSVGIRLMLR
jgi:hypothetical protein